MKTVKTGLITHSILFIVLFMSAAAGAAGISISAEVTSTAIPFEGRDTLIVRLSWEGEPFLYQIDKLPMPSLDKLKILGSSSSVATNSDTTLPAGEATMRTFTYVLEPTDFGTAVIEPLSLTATNRMAKEENQLQTGRLTIEIARPLPKTEESSNKTAVVIIVVVAIIVGAAAVFVYFFQKSRRREPEVDPIRRYLDALEETKKETVADGKLFYSRMYRLLIHYLEKEKGLRLAGRTGEEILREVASLDDDMERARLSGWLGLALKVKFRPEAPSPGDIEDSYRGIYQFFESKLQNK